MTGDELFRHLATVEDNTPNDTRPPATQQGVHNQQKTQLPSPTMTTYFKNKPQALETAFNKNTAPAQPEAA